MVGVGVVVPPPVVIEPGPVKLKVMAKVVLLSDPVPVSDGNDPVSPLKLPVPPVMVADPLPEVADPVSNATGARSVPVNVPPESVMVNGTLTFAPLMEVSETVALKVPFPMPVRVAVP